MLTDGHCHVTDHPETLSCIGEYELRMVAMSTRFDDLELVSSTASEFPGKVVPAFGLHPWYSHLVKTDRSLTKIEHYQSVLEPPPGEGDPVLERLPEPVLLADHIDRLESLLNAHPNALVGEVGLDKMFKIKLKNELHPHKVALAHQRRVLRAQLELANKHCRAVSLHGVGAHQALYDEVLHTARGGIPAVCLHSYGGSPDFYKQCWRKLPLRVYLSLAPFIADKLTARRLDAWLAVVEPDLILTESDVGEAGRFQVNEVKRSLNLLGTEQQIEANFMKFIETNTNT